MILNNSSVNGNTSENSGGGIFSNVNNLSMQNSILALNTSFLGPDCSCLIDNSGYNLIGDTSVCTATSSTGDLLNTNPLLFSLIGSPGFHTLLLNSPAIDAGNQAGCTDHLGNPFNLLTTSSG